jgi:hypothetical protein
MFLELNLDTQIKNQKSTNFNFKSLELNKIINKSLILQFYELVFKISDFRFLGEKIWGRQILLDDYKLPHYIETFEDTNYLKLLGNGRTRTKESIMQNSIYQSQKMKRFFVDKLKTIFLIFLNHELNFFKITLELKKISEIVNFLNEDDKEQFLKDLYKKICDDQEEINETDNQHLFIEVFFVSSKENRGKNFASRIMKILEENLECFQDLLKTLGSFTEDKIFFYATHHPENISSKKALEKSGFSPISEKVYNVKKYNTEKSKNQ